MASRPILIGRTKPRDLLDSAPPTAGVQTYDFLQAAFVADPLDPGVGSWWQQNYRDLPDVALNHPSRWTIEAENASPSTPNCVAGSCAVKELADSTNPWLSPFYYMRGLFISSAEFPGQGPLLTQAAAGTKLALQARVYNYSFVNMPPGSAVHVRFYAQPWDATRNIAASGKNSFLLGEDVLSPIPPFSDTPGAPLNWVLARATFDTTGYHNQFFTFWVLVWMQNADGTLTTEIAGHGLKSVPGTLTSFEQAQTEDYSNNLGFWKQAFYVAPQNQPSSSDPSSGSEGLNIDKIQLSADHVLFGQSIVVSALVSAGSQDASNVETFFWDEDPDPQSSNATETPIAFDLEMPPHIEAGRADQVSAVYRPKTCGTHQLFVSVGLGTPSAVVRRSAPIQVDCGAKGVVK